MIDFVQNTSEYALFLRKTIYIFFSPSTEFPYEGYKYVVEVLLAENKGQGME